MDTERYIKEYYKTHRAPTDGLKRIQWRAILCRWLAQRMATHPFGTPENNRYHAELEDQTYAIQNEVNALNGRAN